MSQASFDAHAAIRKLQRAGCPKPQATVSLVMQATDVSLQLVKDMEQAEKDMLTKGDFYRALWIQGGVLATLISTLAIAMLGFALFLLHTS